MRMRRKIALVSAAILFAVLISGCEGKEREEPENGRINVVAAIFPAYDFTRAIAGDNANITMLISPGSSVHSYDPSPADIKKISEADIFIYNGGESDAWVYRLLSGTDVKDMKVVRLMDSAIAVEENNVEGMEQGDESDESDESGGSAGYDEHIWTSPNNAVKLVTAIADALCEADAKNSDVYSKNADAYIEQIQEVDDEIRNIVENSGKNIIVVADKFPFRYLADEYGLSYGAAFPGCSDQSDASVATIAHLVDMVKENGLQYIYYVELSPQSVANAVAGETGAEPLLLHSCQNVSKQEFEMGETYVSLMRKNAQNLKRGLN